MYNSKIILFTTVILGFTACGLLNEEKKKPAIPGKIVFAAKDDNQNSQIYTMTANGANLKQLTDFPASGEAYSPSWSPDGQHIIFTSFKGGISTGPAIWVMDADGSNQRFLYHPDPDNEHAVPVIGNNPRWSPDGTKIAFDLCLNCQIYTDYTIWVFDTLSKELTQLTPHEDNPGHPASDVYPTWSPDGTQIAFTSNRDYVNGDTLRYRNDLYMVTVDNKGVQRITENGYTGLPIWISGDMVTGFIIFKSSNPVPGIYKLDIQTGEVSLIVAEDPSVYISWYPYSLTQDYSHLLVITFERNPDPEERSTISKLIILNTQTDSLKEILYKSSRNTNPAISSADWFVPE